MPNDIKKVIEESAEETRRHFDVVAEDLGGKIETVAEQVGANTEALQIIKQHLEVIKNGLKQKVDLDEFTALENRVSLLEGKKQ